MIGAIKGKAILVRKDKVTLMTEAGVGYVVYLPSGKIESVSQEEELFVYTYSYVREDTFDLFGFENLRQLNLFELLVGVSGVGPKTALSVVDHGVERIEKAVRDANVTFFTAIPRLGKKNAQKIIIELKSKLGGLRDVDLEGKDEKELADILSALKSMGFSRLESMSVVKQMPDELDTLEEKIRFALKLLGSKNI